MKAELWLQQPIGHLAGFCGLLHQPIRPAVSFRFGARILGPHPGICRNTRKGTP